MASYVLRRRTWYQLMLDMDSALKLPDSIITEQTLENAGLSYDHQLLVRTALQGNLTVDRVCEELVAQRSQVHVKESRSAASSFYKQRCSTGKGKGFKGRKPWGSYYAAEDEIVDESWDGASQSLGGYEESYEEDQMNDEEATEYAADILQMESEAYFLRGKAKGSGHSGFGSGKGGKQYSFRGHLTLEERKARVQAMKVKTSCRRCGQQGHWAGDPSCLKGGKKGGPQKSSGKGFGASSTASTSSGKSKPGKQEKPRQVYFTINEYDNKEVDGYAMLARSYHAVPPPSSLGQASPAPTPTPTTPEDDRENGSWSQVSEEQASENLYMPTTPSPDDELDRLIAEAEQRKRRRENYQEATVKSTR